MVIYVCSECGNRLTTDGQCKECNLWGRDNGRSCGSCECECCGLSEKTRRKIYYILAVVLFALAIGLYFFGDEF